MIGRILAFAAALSLLACGVQEPPAGRSRAGITGGEVDDGDPAVAYLSLTGGGGCTGTLISPRMILTAAHCPLEAPSWGKAMFGTAVNAPTRTVDIIDSVTEPHSDLRLAKLATPIGDILPIPINRTAMSFSEVGKPLRHVGYGLDDYPRGNSDTKRHATLTVTTIRSDSIVFQSNDGLKGVCFGDSGGPGLMRLDGGTEEVIVGVASYLVSDPACYGAASDVRVDSFANWVDEISAGWELESCEGGDGCKAGCVPADTDCFCVHDALCDLRCTKLSLDPDCDAECGQDGVCSGGACPFRDPDCVALGATCSGDSQCETRTCTSQAGKRFCSKGCAVTSECPPSMYCSATNHVCLNRPALGGSCDAAEPCGEGFCAEGLCRTSCESSAACPASQQCVATSGNPGVCRDRPVVPVVPMKTGCAAAPGGLALVGALLFLRRRR